MAFFSLFQRVGKIDFISFSHYGNTYTYMIVTDVVFKITQNTFLYLWKKKKKITVGRERLFFFLLFVIPLKKFVFVIIFSPSKHFCISFPRVNVLYNNNISCKPYIYYKYISFSVDCVLTTITTFLSFCFEILSKNVFSLFSNSRRVS